MDYNQINSKIISIEKQLMIAEVFSKQQMQNQKYNQQSKVGYLHVKNLKNLCDSIKDICDILIYICVNNIFSIMMEIDWQFHYFLANNIWVYSNIMMIAPFIISCLFRYFKQDMNKVLWTDHLARLGLIFTISFYVYDLIVKYVVDGGQSICQKAVIIHHFSSFFIIIPIILNRYVPWWVCPIGFLHGFTISYPEQDWIGYVYAGAILYFQYSLYRKEYSNLKYYTSTRYAINGIWVFCIFLLIGDCSNFLPLSPD